VLALYFTGLDFSISSAIGFVSLFGVSVMDGILMITYYDQVRATGMDATESMFHAATQRMRPMLMTTLSACIGLLPAAVSISVAVKWHKAEKRSVEARRDRLMRNCGTTAALLAAIATSCAALPDMALAQDAIVGTAALPRDLSPWGMYLDADPVVKGVLIGLAVASVITWTVCLTKAIEIWLAKRDVSAALSGLAGARSTAEGLERLTSVGGEVRQFLEAAVAEQELSAGTTQPDRIEGRVASRLERIEAAYGRQILRGTGILATIGATAPFVGLFGTVWGIMNSFIGISKSAATNLAIVSPGIAEALLATAFGLAAAIPAVVIYNVFARLIAGYRAQLGDASAEVLRLVSRDLDRPAAASSAVAAVPLPAAE
jgi:biopolymer transport protein ExbB